LSSSEKDITDWIYENLQGRFYIGSVDVRQPDSRPTFRQALVAFENGSEASYFSLFLPQINQAKVFW
jgi:hypothetical protein